MKLNQWIFFRQYDDCTLVYNTYRHKYYKFSKTVGEFLDLLQQGISYSEIKRILSEKYNLDIVTISRIYDDFIKQLINEELVFHIDNDVTLEEHCVYENTLKTSLYSVTFELTYCCNEHCKHCYVCNDNRKELSFSDYKKIFSDLKKMNVMNLVFTGGEVLCKKDFLLIFNNAIEQGFVVDIYSNGNLFDDSSILQIARRHPRSIHFSIYSLNEETHDYITGVKGSLKKTLDVAQKFIDLGIAVNFKTIVLKNNFSEIISMIDYTREIGATIQIGTSFQLKQDGGTAPLDYMLTEKEIIKIFPKIFEAMNYKKDDIITQKPSDAHICSACFSSIAVNPYGDVYPCISFPLKLGNIRKSLITEIWNNDIVSNWRRQTFSMIEGCSTCSHSSICSFCPGISMQFNGTPLKSYQNACINAKAVLKYLDKGGD